MSEFYVHDFFEWACICGMKSLEVSKSSEHMLE